MKISVITPVYKAAAWVERSLRSLLEQTLHDDVEFILVDDASPDDSVAVVERVAAQYPDREVRVIRHERNQGSAAARQTGLDAARGEWVIQLDADDWAEPDMLESMWNARADADIVVADYIAEFPGRRRYMPQRGSTDALTAMGQLIEGALHGSTSNKLVRRSLYTENDIRFEPGIDIWEDLLINIKLFRHARKIAYVDRAFLHYMQVNEQSLMSAARSEKYTRDIIAATDAIQSFLEKEDLSERFARPLAYKKLHAIRDLIAARTTRADRKAAMARWPEADRGLILSVPGMGLHDRVALRLASRGVWWGAETIWRAAGLTKKIIRK